MPADLCRDWLSSGEEWCREYLGGAFLLIDLHETDNEAHVLSYGLFSDLTAALGETFRNVDRS